MPTDREYFKRIQKGQFTSENLASAPLTEITEVHSRTREISKFGTENAATNVAETGGLVLARKSKLRSVKLLTGTNVASDNTDYVVVTISKRLSNGASQTTLATLNTHGGANGAITRYVPIAFTLTSTGADLEIASGSAITYTVTKAGSGKALGGDTVFSLDFEEI